VFREHRAELVLPMCSSLDWAIKCLEDLATGGPTPLSSGLEKGLELLLIEKRRNREAVPVLVLISDGRANVPLTTFSPIEEELVNFTNQAWKNRIHMIFIDMEQTATASQRQGNYKKILMDRMSYYHIENLTPDTIRDIVAREKGMLMSALT
ncbi:MAG: magnesium chelatase, partial [Syntrophaceae bacterium]|nr:magnesium chelatase [Syntrophaceae bacterium]